MSSEPDYESKRAMTRYKEWLESMEIQRKLAELREAHRRSQIRLAAMLPGHLANKVLADE